MERLRNRWLHRHTEPGCIFFHLLSPCLFEPSVRHRKFTLHPLRDPDILLGDENVPAVLYDSQREIIRRYCAPCPCIGGGGTHTHRGCRLVSAEVKRSVHQNPRLNDVSSHVVARGQDMTDLFHFSRVKDLKKLRIGRF